MGFTEIVGYSATCLMNYIAITKTF